MDEREELLEPRDRIEEVVSALEREDLDAARTGIRSLHPAEIADLIESLPQSEREEVWELLDPEANPEVFAEVEDAVRAERMRGMAPEEVAAIAQDVDVDDAVDILQDLPEEVVEDVLRAMDEQDRRRLEAVLAYPEDTAGGLMSLDVVTVRPDVTLETVQRYLRRRGEIPEKTNRLFVVDRENRFVGELRLADLIIRDPERTVAEVMDSTAQPIPADLPANEVALLFEQRNLITAPVVDDDGHLIGRITVDDVVDVIRDLGEHSLMSLAGLDEEDDVFAPVLVTSRRRTVWLAVNLATALVAAWVIGQFEATIEKVVALAVMMPVVASMGGIAGSQTLTIVIRGMAIGQLRSDNVGWLMSKEALVGLLNGVFWALVMGAIAVAWFGEPQLGLVVGAAMLVNLVIAALAGAAVPLVLDRLRIDPALAGGVVLTTVTDVVGFFTLLGLGTALLLSGG